MESSERDNSHGGVRFFELLLDQFSGLEGELYSATKYLLNSSTEHNYRRRTSLIRIAREKIENAEGLASILLSLAQGNAPKPSTHQRQDDLHDLLTKKSIKTKNYDIAKAYAKKISVLEAIDSVHAAYSCEATKYLKKYIELEGRQVATYERLCGLTDEQAFLRFLKIAQHRQLEHKETFIKLLEAASGEITAA